MLSFSKIRHWLKNTMIGGCVLLSFATTVHAAGYAVVGKIRVEADKACVSCHTKDGNTEVPVFPKLAGQHFEYLVKSMKDFRDKVRPDSTMIFHSVDKLGTDADIEDIAAHFAAQKITACSNFFPENQIKAGEEKAKLCIACHSTDGYSENPNYPKLAGQHFVYLVQSMKAYREGIRENQQMSYMVKMFLRSDSDIDNLAAYFASQQPANCK
jgi:cytochrome c553